ncbi:SDR family NAD(P)-dependent oxidoreductase [Nocardia tengchongensis]|uniref:SDR family NAD(P)-dependent oxidoreductase n=1 Tax=Nocardia tengchongensis TaxID=2055889 RepID=UPI0036B474A4
MSTRITPNRRLIDEIAVVTGAASGMGAATARRFIAEGAQVLLTDIDMERGKQHADELGERARFTHLDVSEPDSWEAAVRLCEAEFGPPSVLMNNAGIHGAGHIESFDQDIWQQNLDVMLYGPLLGMRSVVPVMRKRGRGSIINVSSLQGREADVGLVPYVASKFGLRGITKSAAVELGRYGIRVNAIFPGLIKTGMTHGLPDHLMGRIPLKRPGEPDRAGDADDIAALALFLASDRASNITGAEITIDGGKSVRFPTHVQDFSAEIGRLKAMTGERR